jgi:adenylosuccinate synthase
MNALKIDPIYKTFSGWNCNITSVEIYENMPEKMKTYIEYLNEFLGISINYISNGPGRNQIVSVN